MKLIAARSRQTGLVVILIGLMITIIGLGQYFESKLKVATLVQNNIGSFKKYSALEGNLSYSLPQSWIASEGSSSRENVIYFNEFVSDDTYTHGFIQIIKTKDDMKKLIDVDIKEISDMGIKDYTLNPSKVKGHDGYILQYNLNVNNNKTNKNYTYYIKNQDYIIKASFVINDEKHKENTPIFLQNIVNTISFKDNI